MLDGRVLLTRPFSIGQRHRGPDHAGLPPSRRPHFISYSLRGGWMFRGKQALPDPPRRRMKRHTKQAVSLVTAISFLLFIFGVVLGWWARGTQL